MEQTDVDPQINCDECLEVPLVRFRLGYNEISLCPEHLLELHTLIRIAQALEKENP